MAAAAAAMKVFVTVGTTRFDSLVREVLRDSVLKTLKSQGYTSVKVQAGKSAVPSGGSGAEVYDYKPSLREDIAEADLVVAHAGAGTCLEVHESNINFDYKTCCLALVCNCYAICNNITEQF